MAKVKRKFIRKMLKWLEEHDPEQHNLQYVALRVLDCQMGGRKARDVARKACGFSRDEADLFFHHHYHMSWGEKE